MEVFQICPGGRGPDTDPEQTGKIYICHLALKEAAEKNMGQY